MEKNIFRKLFLFNLVAQASILLALIIGSLNFSGWIFDIESLKGFTPQLPQMRLFTSILLIISSGSLWAFLKNNQLSRNLLRITGGIIVSVSLLTLLTYPWGSKPILYDYLFLNFFLLPENRMALMTTLIFLILGIIFILFGNNSRVEDEIAHVLFIPAALLSYFVLISYILNIYEVFHIGGNPIAPNTGLALFSLCLAVLFVKPQTWLMKILAGPDPGSIMGRRLLPWLLIIPVVIAWFRIKGEQHGYSPGTGAIVASVTFSLFFLFLVWWSAWSVNRIDESRRQSEERFSKAFNNIPVAATIQRVSDNLLTDVNTNFLRLFEYSRDEVINKTSKELNLFADCNDRMKLEEILERDGYIHDCEFEMLTKTSKKLTLLVSSVTIIIQEQKYFLTSAIDITDRKKAEAALRESEQRYSALFANKLNGIAHCRIETDEQGRAVDVLHLQANESYHELLGIRKEVLEGRTMKEVYNIPSQDSLKYLEIFREVALEGTEERFETFFEPTGRYLSIYAYSPKPGEFITIITDITERKETEKKLALLSAIIQYADVAIVSKDLKGNILTWNSGAAKIYGYSAKEIIGKNLSLLIPPGEINEIPELIAKVLREEKIENYQTKRRRKDGKVIPVSLNLSLIKSESVDSVEIIGISNISTDISELKIAEEKLKDYGLYLEEVVNQRTAELEAAKNKAETIANALRESEEQLRHITEQVSIGLAINRISDGKILYINPAYQEILGYNPGELVDQYTPQIYYTESDRLKVVNDLKEQGYLKDYIQKFKRKDGSSVWVSITAQFINFANESAMMGTCFDISQRIEAEEELKISEQAQLKLNKELMRSNKELQQFAYLTSHDLQEPLRTISTFTQFLAQRYKGHFDKDGEQFIHYIVESALRMKSLINDLLTYSRVGSRSSPFTEVDFNHVFEKVVQNLDRKKMP